MKLIKRWFVVVTALLVSTSYDTVSAQTPVITRGPYLQLCTTTTMTIRWRTDLTSVGRVTYGLSASSLTGVMSETASTTEHELQLTNLLPDQRYYYGVGTTTAVMEQTTANFFQTNPPATTKRPLRIASFGDCGVLNTNQANVHTGFLNYRGTTPTDLWMLIGDNAYDGDDAQYQNSFFQPYRDNLLKNTTLFTIPGNHDYINSAALAASHAIPYFSIFTLPANAEAGGVASGTREWYSFDYGPIHFVMLDGYGTRTVGGMQKKVYDDTLNHPQAIWLKQDLTANTKKWTIVYLHFPPYTQGSHNSETEGDLIAIRQRVNPILERFGVDMVVTGHSHVYERSYPIHDHRGPMAEFAASPANFRYPADASSGRYDGSANSCPYLRKSAKQKQGTVYVVSGSAGQLGKIAGLGNHPVMAFTEKNVGGSFYMEVEDNRLDAKFIQANAPSFGVVTDQFTLMKDVSKTQSLTNTAGQSVTLTASFIADYQWSNPASSTFTAVGRTLTVTPSAGTVQTYVVTDSKQCLRDVYTVYTYDGDLSTTKVGNWNDPSVWSANRVPNRFDMVRIGHAITIPANVQALAGQVRYASGKRLFYATGARLQISMQPLR
ncbi:purple acid phosphatase family protein [Fibrella aquatilis]|uniref:Metallophosphoesterase family protein n=1 Tax=Fibrella aquatilis TaxID=2817059 RepID=A0A939G704_9BACT|nr:metallophosphoesterase family protein [Fibrella aquatilis]MBO0931322.1 metallophosphoesterase family protein [Fibrella aquatilis]